MLRRLALMAGAVLLLGAVPVQAQWGYPGGYGGMGWGGWGATTAYGDEARGMGMFAAGAGQYNLDTAQARSINTDTAMRFNEYIYESQQIRNQQYYKQLAERKQRVNETAQTTYKRLKDNPETADIRRGDALNLLLDELTAPGVYASSVSAAQQPLPSALVKRIPFQYAPQAITISLGQLANQVPAVIKDPRFDTERLAVRGLIMGAREESEKNGQISVETLQKIRAAVKVLHAKVKATLPPGPQLTEAENFMKAVYGLARMMETPEIGQFLKELDTVPTTNLGALLSFMHTFNLRFGAANQPEQGVAYDELYGRLKNLSNELFPQGNAPMAIATDATAPRNPESASAFFSGMQMNDVQDKKSMAPAPAPVPAPPPPGR